MLTLWCAGTGASQQDDPGAAAVVSSSHRLSTAHEGDEEEDSGSDSGGDGGGVGRPLTSSSSMRNPSFVAGDSAPSPVAGAGAGAGAGDDSMHAGQADTRGSRASGLSGARGKARFELEPQV